MNKEEKFNKVRSEIQSMGFSIINEDRNRPWGGFFVIDEAQLGNFIEKFFPGTIQTKERMSPKILMVAPQKNLVGNIITADQKYGNLLEEGWGLRKALQIKKDRWLN